MPFIEVDDARIFYQREGQGPAVLLTHGFCATSAAWDPQTAALAPDHTVITWDIRGHGRSEAGLDSEAYSAAASVKDMGRVLDACEVSSAVLGGLSLGGFLSLSFRLTAPQRVDALVLCGTGPGFRREEPRERWNSNAAHTAARIHSEGAAADCQAMHTDPRSHLSPHGLELAARGILPQHDARVIESLPAIEVPTLVVVGDRDEAFLTSADYLESHIVGAQKVVIEGAGHAVNLDQPDAFNEVLLDFVTPLSAGSPHP
jgi:pimeloyl-ACP methyl ester carboxylesterase